MTQIAQVSSRVLGRKAVAGLCLAIGYLLSASTTPAAAPSAAVVAVEPTRIADLVMLNGGFNAGLRQGMVCRISRGNTEVAEVLLVDLRPTCSSALILSLAPKQSIRAGDLASIKVLKT
jgi:hypothetical protein